MNTPLLSGLFSVSPAKKVQFAKGNLWWDGSAYHFEANQTDYPHNAKFNPNHVGHFYWTNLIDYQEGDASRMPYTTSAYSYSSRSTSDKFFCGEDNPLTVDGVGGYFALSIDEWSYLVKTTGSCRKNSDKLRKNNVTVDDKKNCLILAPDDYDFTTNPLKDSYTLDEVNDLGLLCLPAVGYLSETTPEQGWVYNKMIQSYEGSGCYWSSSPSSSEGKSRRFWFTTGDTYRLSETYSERRNYALALRLVKVAE